MNIKIFKNRTEFLFFFVLLIVAAIGSASVYLFKLNGPPIRSDGLGYYVYLPSVFIYNDISLNKFIEAYSADYGDEIQDTWNGATKYEDTGKYLNKYPVGVAVMASPFFIIAHITTVFVNNFVYFPPDGFSSNLYQAMQSISGTIYALVGLFILKRILDRYFKPTIVYCSLIILTFGTNLFHYFTYDAGFSHAYSFFLISLFLFLTIRWHNNPSKLNSILIGLTTGLITIVRPTNLLIVLFFLLWEFEFSSIQAKLKEKWNLFIKNYKNILLIIISGLIVVSIQLIYWYVITGRFIVYSYGEEGFNLTKPEILNVLFSTRKGLFFWAPVLLLIIPGFYLMYKKLKKFFIASIVFLFIYLWVASSWWHWPYGGSFGMRALIDVFPILIFPLALSFERILNIKSKFWRHFAYAVIFLLCAFTTYMMIQYWRGLIPPDGTDWNVFINALEFI